MSSFCKLRGGYKNAKRYPKAKHGPARFVNEAPGNDAVVALKLDEDADVARRRRQESYQVNTPRSRSSFQMMPIGGPDILIAEIFEHLSDEHRKSAVGKQ